MAVACAMAVYVYLIEGVHVAFEDVLVLLALHDRELFTRERERERERGAPPKWGRECGGGEEGGRRRRGWC